jgi:hypothetical protein
MPWLDMPRRAPLRLAGAVPLGRSVVLLARRRRCRRSCRTIDETRAQCHKRGDPDPVRGEDTHGQMGNTLSFEVGMCPVGIERAFPARHQFFGRRWRGWIAGQSNSETSQEASPDRFGSSRPLRQLTQKLTIATTGRVTDRPKPLQGSPPYPGLSMSSQRLG